MEYSYYFNFFLHCHKPDHMNSIEDKNMIRILNRNFIKSFILFNLIAIITNYRKRNRSLHYRISCKSSFN